MLALLVAASQVDWEKHLGREERESKEDGWRRLAAIRPQPLPTTALEPLLTLDRTRRAHIRGGADRLLWRG